MPFRLMTVSYSSNEKKTVVLIYSRVQMDARAAQYSNWLPASKKKTKDVNLN